jgi:hypothetical protein
VNGKVGRLLAAVYTKAGKFNCQHKIGVNKDVYGTNTGMDTPSEHL